MHVGEIPQRFAACDRAWSVYTEAHPEALAEIWTDVPKRLRMTRHLLEKASVRIAEAAEAAVDDTTEFERLSEIAEAYIEAFYHSAWQLIIDIRPLALPGSGKFEPVGIRQARNHLIVHVGKKGQPSSWSISMGSNGDAQLSFAYSADDNEPDWLDPGMLANTGEFTDRFVQRFSP
jgi:hypothetical protein